MTFTALSYLCSIFIYNKSPQDIIDSDIYSFVMLSESPNTPVWFLTALFSMTFLYVLINKFTVNEKVITFLLIILVFISTFDLSYLKVLNLNVALVNLIFFHIGFISQKYKAIYNEISLYRLVIGFVLCLILLVFLSVYNANVYKIHHVDLLKFEYGNIIIYFITAILGILSVLIMSYFLHFTAVSKILDYLGEITILLLGFHTLIPAVVKYLLPELPFRSDRVLSILILMFLVEFTKRNGMYLVNLNMVRKRNNVNI
ncbi:acyltransferase family protein [Vibrio breoganii]